jgi:hypothetical protein
MFTTISKQFDMYNNILTTINKCLSTMEQACANEGTMTKNAIAVIERAIAIKQLEADTKNVVASAGCAFLSSKMNELQSSTSANIIKEVGDNLFTSTISKSSTPQQ